MSEERPYWPAEPRPFVRYLPPYLTPQPMRAVSIRGVWADVQRFIAHATVSYARDRPSLCVTTRRWSAESMQTQPINWLGAWPTECSAEDFDAAVRLATELFGKPRHRASRARAKEDGVMADQLWNVPIARAEDVVDFLERVLNCTGGELAPVHVSCAFAFRLRDLSNGKLIPGQTARHYANTSSLDVRLQRRSTARLSLVLPFGEANDSVADYVVALQEYAPVWIDPRFFDLVTVAPDVSQYHRRRLPPDWIGRTPAGDLRLDPSRSGINSVEATLPTEAEMAVEDPQRDDAAFYASYATVVAALREHTMAASVIRGAWSEAKHMVKEAAKSLDMPLHVVSTEGASKSSPGMAEQLRAIVSSLDDRPSAILVELFWFSRPTSAVVLQQAAGRVLEGVAIPPAARLVVIEHQSRDESIAASQRVTTARDEGFASLQQYQFLTREAYRAAYRDITIEHVPHPEKNGQSTTVIE